MLRILPLRIDYGINILKAFVGGEDFYVAFVRNFRQKLKINSVPWIFLTKYAQLVRNSIKINKKQLLFFQLQIVCRISPTRHSSFRPDMHHITVIKLQNYYNNCSQRAVSRNGNGKTKDFVRGASKCVMTSTEFNSLLWHGHFWQELRQVAKIRTLLESLASQISW